MEVLKEALRYAALGYAVLPLKAGEKVPITAKGLKEATTDAGVLRGWFTRYPRANLGVLPGPGVLVLDADDDEAARMLVGRFPELKKASIVRTPRGWHFYTRVPEGAPELAARTGIFPGVDVRGLGRAYLVAPPSVVGGRRYRAYRAIRKQEELPPTPEEVLTRARVEREAPNRYLPASPEVTSIHDARLRGLLRWAEDTVARARPGTRHHTLLRVGRAMGGYLHLGLDEELVHRVLVQAALTAGLDREEADRTSRWALREGAKAPLVLPERRSA